MKTIRSTWRLSMVLLSACGSTDPGSGDADGSIDVDGGSDGGSSDGRYLPMAVGTSWTYEVTDVGSGDKANKTSTVEAEEDVGGAAPHAGVIAFRVRTEKLDGITVSWQEDTGSAIVRHHEQSFDLLEVMTSEEWYDPYKVRIDESDEHTTVGAQWTEKYLELHIDTPTGDEVTTARANDWTVEATDEEVEVPAGVFQCLRLHRIGAKAGQADKTYWFARGVGKIRESGNQVEELTDYSIAGAD